MSPRLLALMGSGETSPTMVKTHRDLLARVGTAPAVLLDTPFGFQANAADLTARAQAYFSESVGRSLDLASYRSSDEVGSVGYEATLGRLRAAGYVFAGPGSPTYALAQWASSTVPDVLRSKLTTGGCVTFASAAALTLGVATVPVYEIYKVGAPAAWVEGLDLLREAGLSAAVIPHYNNAEGGNHDTRYCYLGEPRLAVMERTLPDGAFVLGIDEHTGVVLDLDAGSATVVGLGVVTVRAAGRSVEFPAGSVVAIADLADAASGRRSPSAAADPRAAQASPAAVVATGPVTSASSPLLAEVAQARAAFTAALDARDASAAAQVVLDLEASLHGWAADTLQSDELDQGRAALRSMVVELAAVAEVGAADPRERLGPFVEALLALRRAARDDKRYADADAVRAALVSLGVEVRDKSDGTEWDLAP
ncbi:MAG TPA: hypothetical protein VM933_04090 [Acidimicrobiales bacterium]|nr:hypothetical protein [Acidimicrobiales bacterium]